MYVHFANLMTVLYKLVVSTFWICTVHVHCIWMLYMSVTILSPTSHASRCAQEYLHRTSSASLGLHHHTGISLAASQLYKYNELNCNSKHLPVSYCTCTVPCVM